MPRRKKYPTYPTLATFEKERDKNAERALRLVWESLETHFGAARKDRHFHKRTIQEYAELMHIIAKMW